MTMENYNRKLHSYRIHCSVYIASTMYLGELKKVPLQEAASEY